MQDVNMTFQREKKKKADPITILIGEEKIHRDAHRVLSTYG